MMAGVVLIGFGLVFAASWGFVLPLVVRRSAPGRPKILAGDPEAQRRFQHRVSRQGLLTGVFLAIVGLVIVVRGGL